MQAWWITLHPKKAWVLNLSAMGQRVSGVIKKTVPRVYWCRNQHRLDVTVVTVVAEATNRAEAKLCP